MLHFVSLHSACSCHPIWPAESRGPQIRVFSGHAYCGSLRAPEPRRERSALLPPPLSPPCAAAAAQAIRDIVASLRSELKQVGPDPQRPVRGWPKLAKVGTQNFRRAAGWKQLARPWFGASGADAMRLALLAGLPGRGWAASGGAHQGTVGRAIPPAPLLRRRCLDRASAAAPPCLTPRPARWFVRSRFRPAKGQAGGGSSPPPSVPWPPHRPHPFEPGPGGTRYGQRAQRLLACRLVAGRTRERERGRKPSSGGHVSSDWRQPGGGAQGSQEIRCFQALKSSGRRLAAAQRRRHLLQPPRCSHHVRHGLPHTRAGPFRQAPSPQATVARLCTGRFYFGRKQCPCCTFLLHCISRCQKYCRSEAFVQHKRCLFQGTRFRSLTSRRRVHSRQALILLCHRLLQGACCFRGSCFAPWTRCWSAGSQSQSPSRSHWPGKQVRACSGLLFVSVGQPAKRQRQRRRGGQLQRACTRVDDAVRCAGWCGGAKSRLKKTDLMGELDVTAGAGA